MSDELDRRDPDSVRENHMYHALRLPHLPASARLAILQCRTRIASLDESNKGLVERLGAVQGELGEAQHKASDAVATIDAIHMHADTCSMCDSAIVSMEPHKRRFQYGPGEDAPWLEVDVPLFTCCNGCTGEDGEPFQWHDWTADAPSNLTVELHLEKARADRAEERALALDNLLTNQLERANKAEAERDELQQMLDRTRDVLLELTPELVARKAVVKAAKAYWDAITPVSRLVTGVELKEALDALGEATDDG